MAQRAKISDIFDDKWFQGDYNPSRTDDDNDGSSDLEEVSTDSESSHASEVTITLLLACASLFSSLKLLKLPLCVGKGNRRTESGTWAVHQRVPTDRNLLWSRLVRSLPRAGARFSEQSDLNFVAVSINRCQLIRRLTDDLQKTKFGSSHTLQETLEKIRVAAQDVSLSMWRLDSSMVTKPHNIFPIFVPESPFQITQFKIWSSS